VLGIDPGVRTGCKLAVVDPTGKLLETATIYPHEPRRDWQGSLATLARLVGQHHVQLVAIGNGTGLVDSIRHLTLPALALAVSSLAIVARVTRASVREEGEREHVQTAVSRGIPARQLIRRHVLRNAAIPITTIAGITIASLIAVAAVVETAFSLNGLGAYLVQAAQSKDLAVVQGISLLLVTAFVVVNLLVDMLYAWLDPRVSLGSRAT